jgi:hypothetical protein
MSQGGSGNDGAGLDILEPGRVIEVGGERLVVREFGFVEQLRAAPIAAPIVVDLARVFDGDESREPSMAELEAVFGTHYQAFLELLALATGKDLAWLQGLKRDAYPLLMAFWSVNSGFFVERLAAEVMIRRQAAANRSGGSASSRP